MTGHVRLGLRTGVVVSKEPTDGYVSVRWDDTGTTTRVPLNRLTKEKT